MELVNGTSGHLRPNAIRFSEEFGVERDFLIGYVPIDFTFVPPLPPYCNGPLRCPFVNRNNCESPMPTA